MFSFLSGDLIYSCLVFYLTAFCLKTSRLKYSNPFVLHVCGISFQGDNADGGVWEQSAERDVTEGWRKITWWEALSCTLHQILVGWTNQGEWTEQGMQCTWGCKCMGYFILEHMKGGYRLGPCSREDIIKVEQCYVRVSLYWSGSWWDVVAKSCEHLDSMKVCVYWNNAFLRCPFHT